MCNTLDNYELCTKKGIIKVVITQLDDQDLKSDIERFNKIGTMARSGIYLVRKNINYSRQLAFGLKWRIKYLCLIFA